MRTIFRVCKDGSRISNLPSKEGKTTQCILKVEKCHNLIYVSKNHADLMYGKVFGWIWSWWRVCSQRRWGDQLRNCCNSRDKIQKQHGPGGGTCTPESCFAGLMHNKGDRLTIGAYRTEPGQAWLPGRWYEQLWPLVRRRRLRRKT